MKIYQRNLSLRSWDVPRGDANFPCCQWNSPSQMNSWSQPNQCGSRNCLHFLPFMCFPKSETIAVVRPWYCTTANSATAKSGKAAQYPNLTVAEN